MAEITLTDLWLHDATDLSSFVQLPLNKLSSVQGEVAGSVRRYAGGRLRFIRRPGDKDSLNVSLVMVSQTTADSINDWTGKLLMLRDPKGRKLFGTYRNVSIGEKAGPVDKVRSVSFRFEEVTETEEV